MPRTFDLDKITAPYQKTVERLRKKLEGEKGLNAKREAAANKVAALEAEIEQVQAELAQAERNLDWAKQAPAPGNAQPVVADESFGEAIVGVGQNEDEPRPSGDQAEGEHYVDHGYTGSQDTPNPA